MKKILLLLTMLVLGWAQMNAQDFTYGDLEYSINYDDVTVTVRGHVDGYEATGTLNIPTMAYYNGNGYTVTVIDNYAFSYCRGLTGTLVIPNTIEEIGDDAFSHCGFTGVVTIPASVEWIGYTPFYDCNGIDGFVVDPANAYYDSRDNCNAIILTDSNKLVIGCKNSTISNTIVAIEEDAFMLVSGLTSITIPNSVTTIGGWAFWYTGLTSINIPSTVTSIGTNPFAGCADLTSITVESDNAVYDSRNDCNAIIKTSTNELISGCQNSVIPDGVTRIGEFAFYFIHTLSGELVIPEQITSIGEYAFEGCSGLTGSLIIPNTVLEIGESAFARCDGFDGRLILSNALTTIPDWAFEQCRGFTGSLEIPGGVTTIGISAFEGCGNFNGTLLLSKVLTYVDDFAFASCAGFTDAVALTETPPDLGMYSFAGFGSTTLVVPCGCISVYEASAWHDQFTDIVEDCASVAEAENQPVKVYPNPTQGRVTIEAENIRHISIYNLLGEKVYESAASGDDYEVDFGGKERGLYLIRIETKNEILTEFVTVM